MVLFFVEDPKLCCESNFEARLNIPHPFTQNYILFNIDLIKLRSSIPIIFS
jgi:hypothetical protein